MASEIRVDKINSLSGVGTVTLSPTGVDIAGITTAATLRATTGIITSLTSGSLTSLGAVSGTTGTFSGAVSGTTGTFTGNLTISSASPALVLTDTDNDSDFNISGSGGQLAFNDTTNSQTRLNITSAGKVGINSTSPEALLTVLQTDTVANSLTFKTAAGQIFRNEDAEFAFGLSNANPYPLFIQGRYKNNTARDITINALGGSVIVGSAVTISESGIEASGIGVTIASLNGGQTSMNRNMVKNGAMVISQRGTSAITWGQGNGYAIDTMRGRNNGGEFSMQQVVDAPAGTGLYYSLKCQVTSADTSIGAAEYNTVVHIVEGYDFQRTAFGTSGAKTLTLSFYVKSNITGAHTGALVNVGNNRSLAYNYTINSANTWERKVISVPGDTSGTWNKADSVGVKIIFPLKVGSNFQTANPNTWAAAELMGTTSGQNLMASTSNNLYLTGIQLEEGTEATPFEHVHYSEALRQCQRYFYRINDNKFRRIGGYKRGDGQCSWEVTTPVPMRTAPSPTLHDGGTFTNFASNFNTSQSSPQISEWEVLQGHGLLVVNSDWSTTYSFIPSWESYALDLSAEF